jgi:sugar diacid utilization regulator
MLTKAQHCFVIAAEAHAAQIRVLTFWSNNRSPLADLPPTIPMNMDWASLLGATEPHVLHRQARRQAYEAIDRLVPGSDHAVIAPMPMPDGESGLFICLYGDNTVPATAEAGIVSILAVQAAVGVQNAELRESLRSKNLSREILETLMLGGDADVGLAGRGRRLGFEVGRPHVVALFDVAPAPGADNLDDVVSSLRRELEVAFPGSLTSDNDQLVTGVLDSSSQTSSEGLLRRLADVRTRVCKARPGATVTIGVSRPCTAVRDYPLAREQARRTLTVGRMLVGPDSVAGFDDLGVQWHLVALAQQPERDVFQLAFERLMDYDRANSTQLFRTIQVYLESLGNAKDASDKLFLHRNTLRQRLDKVTRVAGVDLAAEANWFESMLALRLVLLRTAADRGR